jgi:CubicO group peptidase (beta-lactamase class C family)
VRSDCSRSRCSLSRIPLLRQPGEAWLYNICSDILGVLIARVSGRPLPEFLAERLFEPLGMADTGLELPAGKLDRSPATTGPIRLAVSGTAAHITASTGAVTILFSQLEMAGPAPPAVMRDFWRHAANA